ncbi:MAG TPA: MerR family transcriptional regulator [Gammaproteobacteria bacterium]|nr:MerR family transcriptional regulator [Gammaproteobacteria bacterium]
MQNGELTIGRLARAAGVNVETIRYYQRIGLIEAPARPVQGYRCYPPDAVARVRFIKRAQELGFSLKEVAELLSLNDGDCGEARAIAVRKLALIEQRLADLARLRDVLAATVEACLSSEAEGAPCALIETLNDAGDT